MKNTFDLNELYDLADQTMIIAASHLIAARKRVARLGPLSPATRSVPLLIAADEGDKKDLPPFFTIDGCVVVKDSSLLRLPPADAPDWLMAVYVRGLSAISGIRPEFADTADGRHLATAFDSIPDIKDVTAEAPASLLQKISGLADLRRLTFDSVEASALKAAQDARDDISSGKSRRLAFVDRAGDLADPFLSETTSLHPGAVSVGVSLFLRAFEESLCEAPESAADGGFVKIDGARPMLSTEVKSDVMKAIAKPGVFTGRLGELRNSIAEITSFLVACPYAPKDRINQHAGRNKPKR